MTGISSPPTVRLSGPFHSTGVRMPISYDGKTVDINFNPAYLVDMLKILPEDADLALDLVDGTTPALFRSGPNYSYLVMPLT